MIRLVQIKNSPTKVKVNDNMSVNNLSENFTEHYNLIPNDNKNIDLLNKSPSTIRIKEGKQEKNKF